MLAYNIPTMSTISPTASSSGSGSDSRGRGETFTNEVVIPAKPNDYETLFKN